MVLTEAHKERLSSRYGITRIDYWESKNILVSVDTEQVRAHLKRTDLDSAGILINYPGSSASNIRLDVPHRDQKGKERKYFKKSGDTNALFNPEVNLEKEQEIWITEGELKALCGVDHGLPIVALSGVWCWKISGDNGASYDETLIADLGKVDWTGKIVVLLFDSDIVPGRDAYLAYEKLAEQLYRLKAAEVRILSLPALSNNQKTGLDEFILARGEQAIPELQALKDKIAPYNPDNQLDLKDVAINEGKSGQPKYKFSPTLASTSINKVVNLVMTAGCRDIYRYDGGIWKPDGARIIDKVLCNAAGDLVTSKNLQETLRRVQTDLLDDPVKFNSDPCIFPTSDGVVELGTGLFRPAQPQDHLTFRYSAAYKCPNADYKPFLWFLCSSLPDPRDVLTVLDIITAISLRIPFDVIILLFGGGSNGKGILERVILALFTIKRATAITLEEMSHSRFGPGALLNKDVWIITEVETVKEATSALKKVSTGELLDSDVKYGERVQGMPHVVPILDANKTFDFGDSSWGRKRRFVKIDFPITFGSSAGMRPEDPYLEAKLTRPEVLSGIVQIIAARAPDLIETRKIYRRKSTEEQEEEYNRQRFSLHYFCEECLSKDWDDKDNEPERLTTDRAYSEYLEYCKLFNVTTPSDKSPFGKYIRERFSVESKSTTENKVPLRYYPGLFLVASAKAAYAENKINYSNYRTTTEELQDWISGNNNSNNKTTTTTGEVRSKIVCEVDRMYSFIKSCKDEKDITYENYLKNPVVAVVPVVSREQLVISSTTGEKSAVV